MITFDNEIYWYGCNAFGTAVAANDKIPASGSFIDMSGLDKLVFLIHVGTMDSASTFTVMQDTAATAAAGKVLDTTKAVVVGTDDDGEWVSIEVNAADLDRANSFRYVYLLATGQAGGNDYFAVSALGFGSKKLPVTQAAGYSQAIT